MQEATFPRLFTLPEASRRLGVSHRAIRHAVDRGELEAIRLTASGWPRVTEAAVQRWIAARRI